MMSALVQAHDADDRLAHDELIAMAFLLLVAGHETTVNLIANGMLALITNPDQLAALRANRGLVPGAIEEFLRFESPVRTPTFRFTTEPTELGGVLVPARELVVVSLRLGNRDPDRYADPDHLNIERDTQRPHGVRPRHPLLPGRTTGPPGSGDRVQPPAGHVRPDRTGRTGVRPTWRPGMLIRGLERFPVHLA